MSGNRWLAVCFAISVLINLFLAGIIVGQLSVPAFIRHAPPQAGLVSRQQIRQLPPSERHAFGMAYRRHFPELRAEHERVRAAKLAAEDAIGAPVYDRKALEAKFAAVRQAQLAQQAALHEAVIDALQTLSPQSRAAIASRAKSEGENAP